MAEDNITRLPVSPGPRPLGAAVQNVMTAATKAKRQRDDLMKAHEAAAQFHAALAEAFEAQDEIESGNVDPYWTEKYTKELGRAVVALKAMPIKWQAVLACEIPSPPQDAA